MLKVLGAAVAALTLAWTGAAGAALLYSSSGTLSLDQEENYIPIVAGLSGGPVIPPGYKVGVILQQSSPDLSPSLYIWPTFYAYHNWGTPDQAIIILDDLVIPYDPASPASDLYGTFELTPSATGFSFVARQHPTQCQAIPIGKDCFYAEVTAAEIWYGQNVGESVNYYVYVAAIPEPATWAMMLLGFLLTGSAIRRNGRRQYALTQGSPPSLR